jgi:membrane protease YdiL (CAAX protease family)
LSTPENQPISAPLCDAPPAPPSATVAPAWHTLVLIAAILAVSATGAARLPGAHGAVHRLATYGLTMAMEIVMFAWVLFGLRLKRTSLRSLLGTNVNDLRSIALDFGIAIVFWIGSLMVLVTLAIAWSGIEAAITHRPLLSPNGQPTASQQRTLRTLTQLAPSNGEEIAAWALLCIVAGFVEEAVFRGYLQRQFTAWGKGSAAAGVVFSALMFGAAHGYEGARAMFLITVFGVLFSLLVLFRRSLRPGIVAHFCHDLFFGLLLAALKAQHLI